jgi:hypothetical protein
MERQCSVQLESGPTSLATLDLKEILESENVKNLVILRPVRFGLNSRASWTSCYFSCIVSFHRHWCPVLTIASPELAVFVGGEDVTTQRLHSVYSVHSIHLSLFLLFLFDFCVRTSRYKKASCIVVVVVSVKVCSTDTVYLYIWFRGAVRS